MPDTAEVGQTYEIEIVEETTEEGRFGHAYIGDTTVSVPSAKVGDKLTIKVTSVVTNYWTNRKEATFVKV
jgi:predicted RNA-binding protein with TRAM domain